jgi:hypothetical protein
VTRWDHPRDGAPQLSLFTTAAPAMVPVAALDTIEETFLAFHAANPWVYDALVRLAREWVRLGRRHLGIGMLFEVLRWEWNRATADPASDFKLNNNYRSRYARLMMDQEEDLAGLFELRVLTAP